MRLLIKNVLFTLLVPGTVSVYLPLLLAPDRPAGGSPLVTALAAALFAVGAAGYGWCLWNFASIGRGTPAPIDMPRRLVIVGPHRWVRNPMYLSVLCAVAGWAVLYASILLAAYLVVVAGLFHLAVVLVEEPAADAGVRPRVRGLPPGSAAVAAEDTGLAGRLIFARDRLATRPAFDAPGSV
jgi:protein-S-isoprenylcysteine O-methyltransferase Ste14